MRTMRVAVLLSVVLVAAGCGQADQPSAPTPSTPPTSVSGPATTSSPSATAAAPSGIVIQTCLHGNGRKLQFVDPTTKTATTRVFVTGNYTPTVACTPIARGRDEQRSSYNQDFTLLAAQKKLPNGGLHTGVISVADNEQDTSDRFKDLSGADDSGFGADAQQSVGAFNPKDGQLYFVAKNSDQSKHLLTINPAGGTPQEIQAPAEVKQVSVDANSYPANFGVYFSPGYDAPLFKFDSYQITAKDGSSAFWDAGNGIAYGKPGTTGTLMQGAPEPWIYLDPTHYIGVDHSKLLRVTASGSAAQVTSLLPETDGNIKSPVLSPDGKTIAFILEKPAARVLYTVPAGGGTPVKVMDLDQTVTTLGIVDWR